MKKNLRYFGGDLRLARRALTTEGLRRLLRTGLVPRDEDLKPDWLEELAEHDRLQRRRGA